MKKLFFLFFLLIAFTSYQINAQIINIPADYPTIQQGIDASQDGDTVLVQPGTYYEFVMYNGKNITLASLYLTTGNEDYIEETIIDGNSYGLPCVRFENGETNEAKLIGFTIQNGYTASDSYAAGVHIYNSSATLDHLIIKDNIGQSGGVFIDYSSNPIIKNTSFINNTGSGIITFASNPIIENCKFIGNQAGYGGASALYIWNTATVTLINCLMFGNYGNSTMVSGGNIYLLNTTIANNFSPIGLQIDGGDPRIINTIIAGHQDYNITIGGGVTHIDYCLIGSEADSIPRPYPGALQWGDHNLISSPGFNNILNDDYSLSDCSVGIGAGIDSLIMAEQLLVAPVFDITNGLRPLPAGSNPDMGAYENELGIPWIPPTITLQPIGTSLCEGESYNLYVEVTGSPEITFQWQKNNVDIPDETNDTLQLLDLTPSNEANYRCLVTNMCETRYSNQAFVEVKEYPDITAQPQDVIMYIGDNAQFAVGATGDTLLSYQWYGPSGLLEDDSVSQLIITNVSADDAGNYYCTITNVCGSATSNSATLTAYEKLTISAGTDVTLMLGDSTVLDGSYTGGSQSITIHWTPDTLLYDPNILNSQTVALYSSQAFTLTINDLLVGYQTSDEVFVTVIEDDTLSYFGSENDTLYQYLTRGNCGYISGNNCDLDKIKANYFSDEMISYDIEKVLLRFGKAIKTSVDEVQVKIGIWSKSSTSDTPGDLIDYQEVNLSQIVQDVTAGILTTVIFPTPVAAPKDFFVGVFLPQTIGDTVALMTNKDGESEAGVAWTLNAANEWLSYSSDPRFFLRVSNAIFPVVKQNNVGINDFPQVTGNLLIYPNPANDVLNIQFEAGLNNLDAQLYINDIQGKTMISKQIQQEKTHINISNLNPGVYIIRVEYGQNLMTRKLIVY